MRRKKAVNFLGVPLRDLVPSRQKINVNSKRNLVLTSVLFSCKVLNDGTLF